MWCEGDQNGEVPSPVRSCCFLFYLAASASSILSFPNLFRPPPSAAVLRVQHLGNGQGLRADTPLRVQQDQRQSCCWLAGSMVEPVVLAISGGIIHNGLPLLEKPAKSMDDEECCNGFIRNGVVCRCSAQKGAPQAVFPQLVKITTSGIFVFFQKIPEPFVYFGLRL